MIGFIGLGPIYIPNKNKFFFFLVSIYLDILLYNPPITAYYGSVWIELIVAETENWKYCSKIIFKCVNSVVGPIFNIFKYVNSACTVHKQWILSMKVNNYG